MRPKLNLDSSGFQMLLLILKREVSERISKLNRENWFRHFSGLFNVFCCETFQDLLIFFFFLFFTFTITHTCKVTLFICHNELSSPCGDLLWEHEFSDDPQPYQCYPQQICSQRNLRSMKWQLWLEFMMLHIEKEGNPHSRLAFWP